MSCISWIIYEAGARVKHFQLTSQGDIRRTEPCSEGVSKIVEIEAGESGAFDRVLEAYR